MDFISMFSEISKAAIILMFLVLSVLALLKRVTKVSVLRGLYINYLWTFFLIFTVSEFLSFNVAIWILAILCFVALREYFTLVDIRLQDRWVILGAYL